MDRDGQTAIGVRIVNANETAINTFVGRAPPPPRSLAQHGESHNRHGQHDQKNRPQRYGLVRHRWRQFVNRQENRMIQNMNKMICRIWQRQGLGDMFAEIHLGRRCARHNRQIYDQAQKEQENIRHCAFQSDGHAFPTIRFYSPAWRFYHPTQRFTVNGHRPHRPLHPKRLSLICIFDILMISSAAIRTQSPLSNKN